MFIILSHTQSFTSNDGAYFPWTCRVTSQTCLIPMSVLRAIVDWAFLPMAEAVALRASSGFASLYLYSVSSLQSTKMFWPKRFLLESRVESCSHLLTTQRSGRHWFATG